MFQTSFNTSIRRFAKGNGAVNHSSRTALSLDDVRRIAPSVFAEQKHDSRDEALNHVDDATRELIRRVGANEAETLINA